MKDREAARPSTILFVWHKAANSKICSSKTTTSCCEVKDEREPHFMRPMEITGENGKVLVDNYISNLCQPLSISPFVAVLCGRQIKMPCNHLLLYS